MLLGRKKALVRTAAWNAQVRLGLYPPFYMTVAPAQDWHPDTMVGGSITFSNEVAEALGQLVVDVGPHHELTPLASRALAVASRLGALHPNWVEYCDRDARPGESQESRAMSREWPLPEKVRSWPHFEQAAKDVRTLVDLVTELHPMLVASCGRDITQPVNLPLAA
ncbi:hypothetical protein [Streptomyces nigrescens]|uniref:DUF4268 domain-containing protein n=1 Tax=Streptomyces nigrescens TaxID=1920 RepID=A0ABY7J144_STRNI|nr:hypothetical protein [Streptomyces nigrescens]WAU04017.1 hypothetical protein STRNI_002239 [Streptomyces nigrescens]